MQCLPFHVKRNASANQKLEAINHALVEGGVAYTHVFPVTGEGSVVATKGDSRVFWAQSNGGIAVITVLAIQNGT